MNFINSPMQPKHPRRFLAALLGLALAFGSCTDLEEVPFTNLASSNFNQNADQVGASIRGVYATLANPYDWRYQFLLNDVTTEVGIVPTRGGGWNCCGERPYHEHTWDAATEYTQRNYSFYSDIIGRANFLLENVNDTETFSNEIAEARFLRALAYYQMMDLFGNVPIVTVSVQDPNDLAGNQPLGEQRAKVFAFVEEELRAVIPDLPLKSEAPASYYPRATRGAAQALLAKTYLNAEVYSGTARWEDCIAVCDEIINSGEYELSPSILDNFVPQNQNSVENIFTSVKSALASDQGNGLIQYQLMYNGELAPKFNMPASGWGGFAVLEDHYEDYDEDDFRRSFILAGPQFFDDGTPIYKGAGPNGNGAEANGQFVINPISDIADAKADEGYRSAKYTPDPTQNTPYANNDVVILRYADVLLTKAECQIRLRGEGAGDALINQVRARNFDPAEPVVLAGLQDILDERAFEFSIEGHRRPDLIRFGQFTTKDYKFRVNFDDHRTIFPIPVVELDRNQNLRQNPGY